MSVGALGGGYGGMWPPSWGSIGSGGNPYAQQLAQYQQTQNIYALQAWRGTALPPASPVERVKEFAKSECEEFAWLRGRIKEILWNK